MGNGKRIGRAKTILFVSGRVSVSAIGCQCEIMTKPTKPHPGPKKNNISHEITGPLVARPAFFCRRKFSVFATKQYLPPNTQRAHALLVLKRGRNPPLQERGRHFGRCRLRNPAHTRRFSSDSSLILRRKKTPPIHNFRGGTGIGPRASLGIPNDGRNFISRQAMKLRNV